MQKGNLKLIKKATDSKRLLSGRKQDVTLKLLCKNSILKKYTSPSQNYCQTNSNKK